jgi:Fe/S biogenesis protein NfuA
MKTVQEVQAMLDESVNTLLGQHRGRVEITEINRGDNAEHYFVIAYVKMIGGCRGCAGAKYTLNMLVKNHIMNFDPSINHVVDITDHTDKTNAYYKE